MMRLEKGWVRAGKETEKLSVSEQVIEKGKTHSGSNKQGNNRDAAEDKMCTVGANVHSMQ